jgi:hypothetical protein
VITKTIYNDAATAAAAAAATTAAAAAQTNTAYATTSTSSTSPTSSSSVYVSTDRVGGASYDVIETNGADNFAPEVSVVLNGTRPYQT